MKPRSSGSVILTTLVAISFVVAFTAQIAKAQGAPTWSSMAGNATDVGANASGQVWIVGNSPAGKDHNIYRLQGKAWQQVPGMMAMRIAVGPDGNAWTVSSAGVISHYTGTRWERVIGNATDIGVGENGVVWIVGNDGSVERGVPASETRAESRVRGKSSARVEYVPFIPYRWEKVGSNGSRIAVDAKGNPWVVTSSGEVTQYDGKTWVTLPGRAKDIAVDANGGVYTVSATPAQSGFTVLRLEGNNWLNDGNAGENIAAGAAGMVYVAQNAAVQNALMARTPAASATPAPSAVGSTVSAEQWKALGTTATDVGASPAGEVWVVGSAPAGRDHSIYRLAGKTWQRMPGMAMRIAVGPDGNAWTVNSTGVISHFTGSAWQEVPGTAMDIGVGANGAVWIVGLDHSISRGVLGPVTASAAPANQVRRLGQTPTATQHYTWEKIDGGAIRIAVDPQGNPWVVNAAGQIYHRVGNAWTMFPGAAKDIAVDASGVVYVVGTNAAPGGFIVWRSQGAAWSQDGVAGESIAAGAPGMVYVSKDAAAGYSLVGRTPTAATAGVPPSVGQPAGSVPIPVQAVTITIPPAAGPGTPSGGQSAGSVPIPVQAVTITVPDVTPAQPQVPVTPQTGVTPPLVPTLAGGSQTIVVNSPINLGGATVTTNPNQGPVGSVSVPGVPGGGVSLTGGSLTAGGTLTSGAVPPSATPLTVTGMGYTPIKAPPGATALISGAPYVMTTGKLLCSDPEVLGNCGNVDAGYVGGYTLNMTCSSGFYDPINGGTCWKCPDSDSNGSWVRSADAVNTDTACWRDATSSAHWDKYGLAWNCSSGQFWDSRDYNQKIDGSCWDCPGDYPNRTASAVWTSGACSSHQTHPAAFLGYNGCPKPVQSTMYPKDLRRPGEPFLDIASGLSVANNAGGACWACPVTDEQGNYLYTERNLNSLISHQTGNNGCSVRFRYQAGTFVEPGLSGLPGVSDFFAQEQVFQRPSALTVYLYGLARQQKLSGTAADQFVAKQWADIAAHPYENPQIRGLIFQYMLGHAPGYMYLSGQAGSSPSPAQKKLDAAFQTYIQARRTYVAQEALDAYYAWKNNVGATRSLHAESQLMVLFYYGTVPLDFQSIVAEALVPTAVGVGVLSSTIAAESLQTVGAAQKVYQTAQSTLTAVPRALTLFQVMGDSDAFLALDVVAQFDIVSGPVGIALAGITMSAIAIQQVVQIATAEQNLISARDTARNTTIDLFGLYNQTNGQDQIAMYWTFAMGPSTENEDPQLRAAAQSAYAAALKSNFSQALPTVSPSTTR